MSESPIAFCMQRLPELFTELKANAERRAAGGDKRVEARLADVNAAGVTVRLSFTGDGGGEVFVAMDRGDLRVTRERPEKPPLRYALSVPDSVAQLALGFFSRRLLDDAAQHDALPGFASARADKLFSMYKFAFDLSLSAVPEAGDVLVRIALGRDLPAAPEFTVRAAYPELAAARGRGAGMQELLAAGKIAISGDMAKAMMLGMTLTQLR